jgi:DNA-binding transcriptional ArsR family regulator
MHVELMRRFSKGRHVAARPPSAPSPTPTLGPELLPFFRALADETRLRIVGLLAVRAHTVEELAAALGLRASTVSHHLAKLSEVGLVSARAESWFRIYKLETHVLTRTAAAVHAKADATPEPADLEGSPFDRKVLETYLDAEGRLTAMPSQMKKRLVILQRLAEAFEPGKRYREREVNAVLRRTSETEYVTLRRYLIDHRLLMRETGGRAYWRPAPHPPR